jgi:putative aldouronate transport system substrate-binding protein
MPEYRDLLAFMNRLFSERLLDNNFAVTQETTAHSNMLTGRSALIFTATSRIQNMMAAAPDPSNFTLVGLRALSPERGLRPMYNYTEDAVMFSYWCFIPESTRDVRNALKLLNYLFTPKGNMLANFGEEGLTYNMIDGNPVFSEFTTNNPNRLPLDGILRTYALMNFPIIQDERMMVQRFPLPQQIQAMTVWADSDAALYRIVNPAILPRHANEYAGLLTDINTFIEESRAQFISGARSLDQFDQYIATLRRMGMDRLIQILQESFDAYNR